MTTIHFAIENLAGIPSIIFGLFGNLFFVKICHMQYSILAGALTLSIILLPTIITTTEEALKAIPKTYRESSLGLGATRLQTIARVRSAKCPAWNFSCRDLKHWPNCRGIRSTASYRRNGCQYSKSTGWKFRQRCHPYH